MTPGAIALPRTPCGAASTATERTKACAPFEAL